MMAGSDIGIITVAAGDRRYYRQAELLAISVRTNMPELKIAIVTDFSDVDHRWFSHIIPLNEEWGGGVQQKLFLDRYSPFDHTLFIDSDCIVTRRFDNELEEIGRFSFTPVCEHFLGVGDTDPYIEDMSIALKCCGSDKFPKFNGGVYFFNRDEAAGRVFETARSILADRGGYGVKDFNSQGPGEETIFSLALASLGVENLYDDGGRLMRPTINVGRPFSISPIRGGCRFRFYGTMVEPAICHFVRNNVMDFQYRRAEWLLRNHNGGWRGFGDQLRFLFESLLGFLVYQLKMLRFRIKRLWKGEGV